MKQAESNPSKWDEEMLADPGNFMVIENHGDTSWKEGIYGSLYSFPIILWGFFVCWVFLFGGFWFLGILIRVWNIASRLND